MTVTSWRVPGTALATIALGMFIALTEVDRLIGAISADGYSVTMAAASRLQLSWPAAEAQPWLGLHRLGPGAGLFVGVYVVLDLLMAAALALLMRRLLRRLVDDELVPGDAPLRVFTAPRTWVPFATMAADWAEDLALLLLVTTGGPGATPPAPLVWAAAVLTMAKWLGWLLTLIPLGYAAFGTARGRAWLRRWGRALFVQRFSLFAVAPIAALALIPAPGLWDQLPDVQRAWLDGPTGWWHAAIATVLLGCMCAGLFVLGRLLTDDAADDSGNAPPGVVAPLWQWLYGPVVVGALTVWVLLSGGEVRWVPWGFFVGLPLAVMAASYRLRRRGAEFPVPVGALPPVDRIRRMGDMLAWAVIVVAALGLVRSFTVLAVDNLVAAADWRLRLLPPFGMAAALTPWLLEPRIDSARVEAFSTWVRNRRIPLGWACIVVSTACLIAAAVWPVWFAGRLGVLGALMWSLGSLALLVGAVVSVHGAHPVPEVFRHGWFRLGGTPIATILTVVLVIASTTGSTPGVHGVRGLAAGTATGDSLADVAGAWLERSDDCRVTVPKDPAASKEVTEARPLVLVAAEGGGIRAAYWTAAVLDALSDVPCAAEAIVVASGVSGGSVGLSVARVTAPGAAAESVRDLGGGDALAEATLGLLIRDPAYTVAGLPALIDHRWTDRAGLMEAAWERAVPDLGADFYGPAPEGALLAAPLILNSTDALAGCRVLVTQIEFPAGEEGTSSCAERGAPLPRSRDFRSYLVDPDHAEDGDHCLPGISMATAAMLSARFPYVTPSGVVGPCRGARQTQLVDGGYVENSGLGTLLDVAPGLIGAAVAASGDVPVVPIVVWLDNGRGGDLLPAPPRSRPEVLVPPLTALGVRTSQISPEAWLQRASVLSVGRGEEVLGTRVYVVAQGSAPTVQAPLGWVLSDASVVDMDASIAAATACATAGQPETTAYPGLRGLVALFGACG